MPAHRLPTALGAVLLPLLVVGFGLAQDDVQGEFDDDEPVGELPVQRRAQLTPQEQLREAAEIAQRGESVSRQLLQQLDEARRQNDIILVTCLNDKLTQVNTHRRTLESRTSSLEEAANLGDESRRNHEFTVITVLGQHFATLQAEANSCLGIDEYAVGVTALDVTVDPATPDIDPTLDMNVDGEAALTGTGPDLDPRGVPQLFGAEPPFIRPPISGDS
ncbi:MAG: hypothetical protein ACFCGT_08055 [Sandaracinaceae bacterium]